MVETKKHEKFAKWIKEQVERTGNLRKAAQKAGVVHGTLIRAMDGEDLNLATLEAIAKWTNVPLSTVLDLYSGTVPMDRSVETELVRLFGQYPELRGVLETAIENLDAEGLREVLRYIEFQAQKRQG